MVNIVRSTQQAPLGGASIIPSASNSGAAAIGQSVTQGARAIENSNAVLNNSIAQFGSAVEAEGAKLFAESKRAHQSALLLDKMSSATETFTAARIERSKQSTDENGNPTFGTLVQDVGAIGTKMMEEHSKTIVDPEVAAQFKLQFSNFVANQKVSALREAAAQQVDFSRATLNKGLYSLTNQAAADTFDQVGTYDNMGRTALDDALHSGAISAVEHEKMSRGFSNQIRVESLKNTIAQNRGEAVRVLGQSAADLGIEPGQHEHLVKTVKAAIRSDYLEAQRAKEVLTLDQQVAQAQITEMLETRMESGALREDELLGFKDKVTPKRFEHLKKKYVQETAKQYVQRAEFADMGARINNGEDLTNEKPSKVSKFYDYMLGQQADTTGKKPTLSEEAQLAAAIPAPVKPFTEKLEYSAIHGDTANAAEALSAYTYIKDRKSAAIDSGFNSKATAVMEHMALLVERGGMDPAEAMAQARDKVMNAKDEEVRMRKQEFRKEKSFQAKNLEETAASALDAETWYGKNQISDTAIADFKRFAEEGYTMTGDKEAAKAYAKEHMSKTYGMSSVGGKEEMVYMPPEKVFPGMDSKTLRKVLVTEVQEGINPDIDPSKISLKADPLTFRRDKPSWIVTEKKAVQGVDIEMPLVNPRTGEVVRWSPAGSSVISRMQAEEQAAANAKAEAARQKYVTNATNDLNPTVDGP